VFALRQFFLVFLIIYMFAALAEHFFQWMPCTVFRDFKTYDSSVESDADLKFFGDLYYMTDAEDENQCEYADPDLGSLDINLVFSQFSSIIIMLFWCFVSRDPQEPFTYMISKANVEEMRDKASKKMIFIFFLAYFCFMITFTYVGRSLPSERSERGRSNTRRAPLGPLEHLVGGTALVRYDRLNFGL